MSNNSECHRPDCSWIYLPNLNEPRNVPPLLPNSDVSGIGVILGFSITAYLTLALLILHYITIHNVHRTDSKGEEYISPVDRGILSFVRKRLISWSPSKRFEYAMEKSVLILSDLNLVTGIGVLIAGYSQLKCGISAYHWQIMVSVAWIASFSFASAMTFLEDYFQTNNNMRIIRLFFMSILASLLLVALLPTGSRAWLNQYVGDGDGFYPSLSAVCYYRQLGTSSFVRRGPKIWSMLFSVVVITSSYIYCGIRLFDPRAETTRKYFRTWPGSKYKQMLYFVERRALRDDFQATFWHVLYLSLYASFTSIRAFCDILESMLLEIVWLTFAMAWGTIKVWDTRAMASFNFDGKTITINSKVVEENSWSFGQTLPLFLVVLPLLSMAQAYLDNDAKALEAQERADRLEEITQRSAAPASPPRSISPPPPASPKERRVELPRYPYLQFTSHMWYHDHIFLLLCQILMVAIFALRVLTSSTNVFGMSTILRNRLFLIWILGMVPFASMVHLGLWYMAALIVCRWTGAKDWLRGKEEEEEEERHARTEGPWWKSITRAKLVTWTLRLGLVSVCLMFTLLLSLEFAGPNSL
ncbi:uncharacterized protein K460DRAFT_289947 [Cucurbitaria berberidis CBS 394.84]|uniref:Uncharacterized protein n=1 Tax=Cucurbitaria berberidis CBS 394.84 TaxID=1168544 RepID=A0A9P4GDJ1_9PLEO|nr:uncharacterized protein K460DRAFT_289947 [Cucurbitaria berberidis CBS 394.84]KAF1843356.1 hypothetical protein K460DRAFT_289947 [Cucurbitaria berberidis CBS 394.84]